MHPDLSKAYDLLGVKPGVSNRELKAAHRDLAKVWHPDRFLHDPRLQDKAQEKLKEINEAYELLISGKVPKAAPSRSVEPVYSPTPVTRRSSTSSRDRHKLQKSGPDPLDRCVRTQLCRRSEAVEPRS